MIPLLVFAAGAAALEIKRLVNRPQGAEQTEAVLERERHLHQVLQVLLRVVLGARAMLLMNLHAYTSLQSWARLLSYTCCPNLFNDSHLQTIIGKHTICPVGRQHACPPFMYILKSSVCTECAAW